MDTEMELDLKSFIRSIPDFPKPGVVFRDITTLLKNPKAMEQAIGRIEKKIKGKNIDAIAGIESRGFIFGSILAYKLGLPLIPIRKKGKLPHNTEVVEYEKEYGMDSLEIHKDAVTHGQNILIVDDLLAIGGTSKAAAELIEKVGGTVAGLCFLIELSFLKGRKKLDGYDVISLVDYENE